MTHEDFFNRLQAKTGFEPLSKDNTADRIRSNGRVRQPNVAIWLQVVERLLMRSQSAPWKVDISKQYFMQGDELKYSWRIIIQCADVLKYLPDILSTIDSAPMVVNTSDEIPLHGNPDRLALKNGKGAQPLGSFVAGKAART